MKTYFEKDNFTSRRTTGHNAYDPESLLTGVEIAAGFGYGDTRDWSNDGRCGTYEAQARYDHAVAGNISCELIAVIAPRRKRVVRSVSELARLEEEG